eukprot:15333789-Ditylum_brightwellii.AAC.1
MPQSKGSCRKADVSSTAELPTVTLPPPSPPLRQSLGNKNITRPVENTILKKRSPPKKKEGRGRRRRRARRRRKRKCK